MSTLKPIRTALVSVYSKDRITPIVKKLHELGVELLSTGGSRTFIESLGIPCRAVEDLTGYPSILGGRVKTLHPKVFGGILARRDNDTDRAELAQYEIPTIDLVIVDLYPFEATVASGASEQDIIEKIDIGGISLIRAAAKNFADTLIVASDAQFAYLEGILDRNGASSTLEERRYLAREAFAVSSGYDSAIFNWFALTGNGEAEHLRVAIDGAKDLRYGENPHQQARYYGNFDALFEQLHGKEISYNNLLDIDAACALIDEFDTTTVAILKHNNACGLASRPMVLDAWRDALAGDPVSAFGGIIICNSRIEANAAEEIGKIFFEVIIAPEYSDDALAILRQKKNRIILQRRQAAAPAMKMRTILGGVLMQENDSKVETPEELKLVAGESLPAELAADMIFANKIVKHSKSNAIVLARNGQLIASGVGQTSRVDALRHAIEKAHSFNFDLKGAVMASDAFFPFADCVEIAHTAGVDAVIQPGGSIRDTDSVEYCRNNGMTMVMTGFRHFRH
ncbi:MAG: bifunctional phosphoribosylaminoimidazolecarboxamide formyltransferase/IMP cyclohydrolase [Muribaculaceae bacterium]|nr:bifunctional phosphoribosylaminoimidazolecarboxamide formyltransferase/IMP cyclohydrolase [Muribaculaceae bacterium]MDE6196918.1 bifunctional phosphoribosylaminoimidazolecarboxamide formyltransferase/IMP cyclohydrolase [Muribaculaceae bacterium]